LSTRPSQPTAPVTVAAAENVVHDTVNVVRFVFVGDARSVALVGDFNAWSGDATPLATAGTDRTWSVSVPLARGRHEYAFIVDGKRWVADPFAPATSDEFNTSSSVITVGT
jgi:1,4-alpha-glucan branching enzyme